jgi:dihydrofolate reductase
MVKAGAGSGIHREEPFPMRNIVVGTFLTLDGVMQAPGGPEEDPSGGFAHGGWSVTYWDDDMGRHMDASIAEPFDLLLGRKTYEIFAAHWPHVTGEPMADALNRATKYVVSTTLDRADWRGSVVIRPGDASVPEQIRRLKEEDGPEIQVHGSGELIQALLAHDLIDRFRLMIFPVVLGSGRRLFGGGAVPAGLRLVEAKTSTTGVILATYERAGAIRYGSFALEEPTEAEVERRGRHAEGAG